MKHAPFTALDFARHAVLFGVRDAAAAMRLGNYPLPQAQRVMRQAMRGFRIAYFPKGGLWQWLPVAVRVRR